MCDVYLYPVQNVRLVVTLAQWTTRTRQRPSVQQGGVVHGVARKLIQMVTMVYVWVSPQPVTASFLTFVCFCKISLYFFIADHVG